MDTGRKVQENRIRRVASRRGFSVTKVRRIDTLAVDHGLIQIRKDGVVVFESKNLDAVEEFIDSPEAVNSNENSSFSFARPSAVALSF
jgi:hypothetical protein